MTAVRTQPSLPVTVTSTMSFSSCTLVKLMAASTVMRLSSRRCSTATLILVCQSLLAVRLASPRPANRGDKHVDDVKMTALNDRRQCRTITSSQ